MCLFHDLHEARTGDHNYVNKRYVRVDENRAVGDLSEGLHFAETIISLTREFNDGKTPEAAVSRDADQLDLILALKEQQDLGNKYATEWLSYAVPRLCTATGKRMAEEIIQTDSTEWWFDKNTEWWVNGPGTDHGDRG